jgi:diaminopimelate decarboxylase
VEPRFVPAARSQDLHVEGSEVVDIVGPICEGADFLAKDRPLPPLQRGDLLAVFTTGAYGFTMSSNYNARPRAPEVLVAGDEFRVIRRRETYEDLIAPEQ